MLVDSKISNNVASYWGIGYGGGIDSDNSQLTLMDSIVRHNVAGRIKTGYGGGVFGRSGSVTMRNARIESNRNGQGYGGGLYLMDGATMDIQTTRVVGNQAPEGGGIYLAHSGQATLNRSYVQRNRADRTANVIVKNLSGLFFMDNAIVADNDVSSDPEGAGLFIDTPIAILRHNTIAQNGGKYGVLVTSGQTQLRNSIFADHLVGVRAVTGGKASLTGVLWWKNDVEYSGDVSTSGNVYGNPRFVDVGCGDYHITPASAAIDAGSSAPASVVPNDIDGDPRPVGAGYDLGADEYVAWMRLPLVLH